MNFVSGRPDGDAPFDRLLVPDTVDTGRFIDTPGGGHLDVTPDSPRCHLLIHLYYDFILLEWPRQMR